MNIKHQDYLILAVQGSYQKSSLTLAKNNKILSNVNLDSFQASSQLIPCIQNLLKKEGLLVSDLTHLAVDKGPGAFSSLRVTLTTINALAYALQIPIVEFNGLEIVAKSFVSDKNIDSGFIASIFNAYSSQVYFSLFDVKNNTFLLKDLCFNLQEIDEVLEKVDLDKNEILFAGALPENLNFDFKIENYSVSSEKIALASLEKIKNKKNYLDFVYPLYIKPGFYS